MGGLVLQASSNSVNVLVRALQNQGRIDILSRPTVMTYDNQSASLNLGQLIPYLSNTSVTSTGVITSNIAQKQIGVILNVTPRIAPDGRVIMRVTPEVSSLITTPFNLGNGQIGTGFNVQSVDTSYHVEQVSDFDGDGHADILWRSTSGVNALWDMNPNGTIKSSANVQSVDPTYAAFGTHFDLI